MSEHRPGRPGDPGAPGPAGRAVAGPAGPGPAGPGPGAGGHASSLSAVKVTGQALAAVTTAGVGSFLGGAGGTVVGAAFASVVTTVGDVVYQRSLQRTHETVRDRLRGRATGPPSSRPPRTGAAPAPPEPPTSTMNGPTMTMRRFDQGPGTTPPGPPRTPAGGGALSGTAPSRPSRGAHAAAPAPDDSPTDSFPTPDPTVLAATRVTSSPSPPGTRMMPAGGPDDPDSGRTPLAASPYEGEGPEDGYEDGEYGGGDGQDDDAGPRKRPWKRWVLLGATSLLIFLIAMVAITGIERVKGSALSGGTGTSIGEVFGAPGTAATTTSAAPDDGGASGSASATTAASRTGRSSSAAPTTSRAPRTTTRAPVTTTAAPVPTG